MTLTTFAAKNLFRHKSRTGLTILGVAIATATLFVVLSFDKGYQAALDEELAGSGIHLFVSTEGCPLEAASLILHGGEIPKFLAMDRLQEVKAMEGVKEAAGFLIFSLPSPSGDKIDLFYGITDDALKLKPAWKVQGTWFRDSNSIILGSEVARVEKRKPGDKVYMESLDKEFEVVGVLEKTNGQDDGFYFLPLPTAQRLFRKENKLTAVGVQLKDFFHLEAVKGRLETLPDVYVVTSEQINGEIMRFVGGTKALMYAMLAIAFLVGALGILNTILMSSMERKKEFGYLRCVGAGKGGLFKLMLLETLFVSLIGWTLGVASGYSFSSGIESWMKQFLAYVPSGSLVRPDVEVFGLSVMVTLSIGLLAGLYPAFRVSRISPMEAVRNE